MTLPELIKEYRIKHNISQRQFALRCGVSNANISMIEKNLNPKTGQPLVPTLPMLHKIAKGMNMTIDELFAAVEDFRVDMTSGNTPEVASDTVTFPVIGEIAAGYDLFAEQSYDTTDTVEIPLSYFKGKDRMNFLILRVRGDSMYPMYLDKDIVLVERSDDKPESGKVLAVRYEDFATIKKVEFDDAFEKVKFIPINPMYQIKELSPEEKEQFEFIGYPRRLIRDL